MFLGHGLVDRLHGRRRAGGGGASWFLTRRSGVRLLLAGARSLSRPGGRSGDETPPPHAANSPPDESGPASAMWRVGGILAEELENSPQRERRSLEEENEQKMQERVKIYFGFAFTVHR